MLPKRPSYRMRGFFGALIRWTYRSVMAVSIAAAGLVLLSQTDLFKNHLTIVVVELVNSSLEATITIESAELDFFRGVSVSDPRLYAAGTLAFRAKQVCVSFELLQLLGGTLAFDRIQIDEPEVTLITMEDGSWNYDHIIIPDTAQSEPAPFNWNVLCKRLLIKDAHIIVNDRTSDWPPPHNFDPVHVVVRNFNLDAFLRHIPSYDSTLVVLNSLSLSVDNSDFNLQSLRASIGVGKHGISVDYLEVQTPMSLIAGGLRWPFNSVVDDSESPLFSRNPIMMQLRESTVYGRDVAFFVPEAGFDSTATIDALVRYAGNQLNVNQLKLQTHYAVINGDIEISGLDSGKIYLDLSLKNSRIDYSGIVAIRNIAEVPDLPFLPMVNIASLQLRGEVEDTLWTMCDISTANGDIRGELSLDYRSDELAYRSDLYTRDFDLNHFAGISDEPTLINGRVLTSGRGFDIARMSGTYKVELTSSIIVGKAITSAIAIVEADATGRFNLDTLWANVTPPKSSDSALGSDTKVDVPRQIITASGRLDFSNPNLPLYDSYIALESVDISALLNNPGLPDLATAQFEVRGSGISLTDAVLTAKVKSKRLVLKDRALRRFEATIALSRTGDSIVVLELNSPFANAYVSGLFRLDELATIVESAITVSWTSLGGRLLDKFEGTAYWDSLSVTMPEADIYFNIGIEDVSPFLMFIPNLELTLGAHATGHLKSNISTLQLELDSVIIQHLYLGGKEQRFTVDPTSIRGSLAIHDLDSSPKIQPGSLYYKTDSVVQVGGNDISFPTAIVSWAGDSLFMTASASVGGIASSMSMRMLVAENSVVIRVDTLQVIADSSMGLMWFTPDTGYITISNRRVILRNLELRRPFGETIILKGALSVDGPEGFAIRLQNFPLRDIQRLGGLPPTNPISLLRGLISDLKLTLNGTWKEPSALLSMTATDISYNAEPIGMLHTEMKFIERNATGTATIFDGRGERADTIMTLDVERLALDLSTGNVQHRLIPDSPIEVYLKASALPMAAIEPFLPAIEKVQGRISAGISVQGTTTDPSFSGTAAYRNATFTASATNVRYSSDGVLSLVDNILNLDTIIVRNQSRDLNGGIARGSGSVVFKGMQVDSIDITVQTPNLVVLNMQSQATNPDLYGDLRIATGRKPLRLFGKLHSPKLHGDVIVRYGDLVFPRERSTTKRRLTDFRYVPPVMDGIPRKSITDVIFSSDTALERGLGEEEAVVVKAVPAIGFADALEYNLNIDIGGRLLLTMILGVTEAIVADIELADLRRPLVFSGSFSKGTNLEGKVRLKEQTSSYKFFRSFNAGGDLDFSQFGMTNPVLNLKAVYRGTRLVNEQSETFRVEIDITGTKELPNLAFRVYRNEREMVGDSTKIRSDAIMLILLNRTQDELFAEGQGNLVSEVNASLSAVASQTFNELFQGIGFVDNAQFDAASNLEESRVTLSGRIIGDVSYKLSGTISDIAGNNTFTVTVPLTVLSDREAFRFFVAEFSRAVNQTGNITRQTPLWQIRVGARLP